MVSIIISNIAILFYSRSKPSLRMTKSLTVDTGLSSMPINEDEELVCDTTEHLSDLDQLVIDTSLNISNKLCLSAGNVINQTSRKFSVTDNKVLDDVETLSYVLEDVHVNDGDPSHQLSSLLRNMKKIEQALELTNSIIKERI